MESSAGDCLAYKRPPMRFMRCRRHLSGLRRGAGDPAPPGGTRAIIINVRQFAGQDGKKVALRADWSLMSDQQQPRVMRNESITVPLKSDDVEDVVSVMSAAIGELSNRIASGILTHVLASNRAL